MNIRLIYKKSADFEAYYEIIECLIAIREKCLLRVK